MTKHLFAAQARKRRWSEPMRKEEEMLDIEPPQVEISEHNGNI